MAPLGGMGTETGKSLSDLREANEEHDDDTSAAGGDVQIQVKEELS